MKKRVTGIHFLSMGWLGVPETERNERRRFSGTPREEILLTIGQVYAGSIRSGPNWFRPVILRHLKFLRKFPYPFPTRYLAGQKPGRPYNTLAIPIGKKGYRPRQRH